MAKIVQVLTRPSEQYDLGTAEAQVRDIDAIIEKLNTTFQEELTTTDNTTLFTVPDFTQSVIRSILVSEYAGSGSTITVTLTDASSNVFNLFTTKTIASNATTELLTNPLILEEKEVLKVQAANANRLQVLASILEIQPRTVVGGGGAS